MLWLIKLNGWSFHFLITSTTGIKHQLGLEKKKKGFYIEDKHPTLILSCAYHWDWIEEQSCAAYRRYCSLSAFWTSRWIVVAGSCCCFLVISCQLQPMMLSSKGWHLDLHNNSLQNFLTTFMFWEDNFYLF